MIKLTPTANLFLKKFSTWASVSPALLLLIIKLLGIEEKLGLSSEQIITLAISLLGLIPVVVASVAVDQGLDKPA